MLKMMFEKNDMNSFLNRSLIISLFIVLVSACTTTPNHAPVIEKSSGVTKQEEKPNLAATPEKTERPTYVVKRGDTLGKIAQENGKSYADVLSWNNIVNPNDIKVGQVLWMGPVDGSESSKTSVVNLNSGIEIRNLTPINPSTNKTEPKGEKLAYSEENLAELRKVDLGSATASVAKNEVGVPEVKPNPAINWVWPVEGRVSALFDEKKNKGINVAGKLGQSVFAAADGKVMYAGSAYRGYGNMLIIQHANNFLSAYAHNKVNLVKEGQYVTKGQKVAEMGNTDSDTTKLHFEIRQAGKPVDPLKHLPNR